MQRKWVWLLPMLLAGCMSAIPPQASAPPARRPGRAATPPARLAPPPPPAPPPFQPPAVEPVPGIEGLIEQNGASLIRQFGAPRLDVREGDMRKLQFAGPACVLDVFLYPLRQGAEPVATAVLARRASDGQDVDKAACVAALLKR